MHYLRGQLNVSQQKVADGLTITRGLYAKYEDGAEELPLEILLKISRYFHVSIDLMLSVDLRRTPLKEIMDLPDNHILLPIKPYRFWDPINSGHSLSREILCLLIKTVLISLEDMLNGWITLKKEKDISSLQEMEV